MMPPKHWFMHSSRLTSTIATPCLMDCHSTNLTVYSVSLMQKRASPAISQGTLLSPLRCSNSTGLLLPRGLDLRPCCWFTKRLKAPLHLTQLSYYTSSLRVVTHCVTTINTSSSSNELNGKVCHQQFVIQRT